MRQIGITYFLLFYGFLGAAKGIFYNNIFWRLTSTVLNIAKNNVDDNFNNTIGLIRKAGYPTETHIVLTEDGYLLTMHRIPGGKNFPPVLLQHGLLSTSVQYIILGREKALAYMLADQGYDVWLGNFRGNTYSKAHISLSPSDPKFWDFSFDEMGIYDLPAMITYITNLTAQPLHTYIGHSMGTTSFYVMAAKRPDIAKMIRLTISIAPVVFVKHMTSPMRYLTIFINSMEALTSFLDMNKSIASRYLTKYECSNDLFERKFCLYIISLFTGLDEEQLDDTALPVILANFPSSISIKTVLHYVQGIKSGKFCAYDYGRYKNMQIYNATVPPDYDISRITTPIALIYADNDWFVAKKDLNKLRALLPNITDDYRVPFSKFNHIDFVWAKDAPTLVYQQILKIMEKNVN